MANYHDLVLSLEHAINNLDSRIFADRQTTGKHEYYEAHEHCKDLSYIKCQIINNLRAAGEDTTHPEPVKKTLRFVTDKEFDPMTAAALNMRFLGFLARFSEALGKDITDTAGIAHDILQDADIDQN